MLTYKQKKALVLEIDQICEAQSKEHDRSLEIKQRHEKNKKAAWRNWDKWASADLNRWAAYNEMRTLVVKRLFDCVDKDVLHIIHDLRKEA